VRGATALPRGRRLAQAVRRAQAEIVVVDVARGVVVSRRQTPIRPRISLALPAGPGLVLARTAPGAARLELIGANGATSATIPLPGVPTLAGGLAVSPDGSRMVIAPRLGRLVDVDLAHATFRTVARPDVVAGRRRARRGDGDRPGPLERARPRRGDPLAALLASGSLPVGPGLPAHRRRRPLRVCVGAVLGTAHGDVLRMADGKRVATWRWPDGISVLPIDEVGVRATGSD
jgi:hypothetical protein